MCICKLLCVFGCAVNACHYIQRAGVAATQRHQRIAVINRAQELSSGIIITPQKDEQKVIRARWVDGSQKKKGDLCEGSVSSSETVRSPKSVSETLNSFLFLQSYKNEQIRSIG